MREIRKFTKLDLQSESNSLISERAMNVKEHIGSDLGDLRAKYYIWVL